MKAKMALKLILLGSLITAVGYWLRGHDVLTGVVLVLLFLWAIAKVIFAIIQRHRDSGSNGGGPRPPYAPIPIPPNRPKPPELAAALK